MTDIVERLRDWLDEDKPIGVIMNEAALGGQDAE